MVLLQATFTDANTLVLSGLTSTAQSFAAGGATSVYPIQASDPGRVLCVPYHPHHQHDNCLLSAEACLHALWQVPKPVLLCAGLHKRHGPRTIR